MAKIKGNGKNSSLILCRTSKDVIKRGIPIITKGEGCYIFDRARSWGRPSVSK